MLDGDYPLRYMRDHLRNLIQEGQPHADEYAKLLPQLDFALQVEKQLIPWTMNRLNLKDGRIREWRKDKTLNAMAQQVARQVGTCEDVLLPAFVTCGLLAGHAMYVQVAKEQDASGQGTGNHTLRLFNASMLPGWERGFNDLHARGPNGKWQTMFEVGPVSAENLQAKDFRALFGLATDMNPGRHGIAEVDDVYAWLTARGTVIHNSDRGGHTVQTSPNCTHKSVMVFLQYALSEPAYRQAKLMLLEDAVAQFASPRQAAANPFLVGLVTTKRDKALARAAGQRVPPSVLHAVPDTIPPLPHLDTSALANPWVGTPSFRCAQAQRFDDLVRSPVTSIDSADEQWRFAVGWDSAPFVSKKSVHATWGVGGAKTTTYRFPYHANIGGNFGHWVMRDRAVALWAIRYDNGKLLAWVASRDGVHTRVDTVPLDTLHLGQTASVNVAGVNVTLSTDVAGTLVLGESAVSS